MAGGGGGRRAKRPPSRGETPKALRRSTRTLMASTPQGGPPLQDPGSNPSPTPLVAPPPLRVLQEVPALPPPGDSKRPLTSRKSPRFHSQKEKENVPEQEEEGAAPRSPGCPSALPPLPPPSPPPSPSLPPIAPRVRRSYSRLEAGGGLGGGLGGPLSPILAPLAPPHQPLPKDPPQTLPPDPDLPGIGPSHPERRRRKKVAPIDLQELEAWAAQLNAQLEEAASFSLVVE